MHIVVRRNVAHREIPTTIGLRGLGSMLAAWLALTSLRTEAQTGAVPDSGIRPTVTVASGDTGGRFFGHLPDPERVRHYYVAAESVLWDYAPSGKDEICGLPLPPPLVKERRAGKVRYIQYTDASFTARVLPDRSLGMLGPVLRGVTGEFLVVTFLNRSDQPLSMHPHGVKYDKDSEGALTLPAPGRGAAVAPGARFTYVWHLDEAAGPLPTEPSSRAWLYHSHVTADTEANLGLVGAIVVTDPARARPDGTPRDVDREFATLFMIFDESGLDAAAIEAAEYAGLPGMASAEPPMTWAQTQQALEQGARSAINGYVFGNLPGLQMNEGERVRWYLLGLGSEADFHTAHWHGLRVIENGNRRTDVIELLPASMKVADMVADNPGSWLFHCHVSAHMTEGMFARVTVHGRDTVGVGRRPEQSFLGCGQATSLRFESIGRAGSRGCVTTGAVTVFDGFAIFNETVVVATNGRRFEFHPGPQGLATKDGATFRITNANEVGVVRGDVMTFELTLPEAPAGTPFDVTMDVARGRHHARLVPLDR